MNPAEASAPALDPQANPWKASELFQACLGLSAVVFAVLLNRVMLSEPGLSRLLGGWSLAFEQFVASSRVCSEKSPILPFVCAATRTPTSGLGAACFLRDWPCLVVRSLFRLAGLFLTAQESQGGVIGIVLCSAACSPATPGGVDGQHGQHGLLPAPLVNWIAPPSSTRSRAVGIIWLACSCRDCHWGHFDCLSLRSSMGSADPGRAEVGGCPLSWFARPCWCSRSPFWPRWGVGPPALPAA